MIEKHYYVCVMPGLHVDGEEILSGDVFEFYKHNDNFDDDERLDLYPLKTQNKMGMVWLIIHRGSSAAEHFVKLKNPLAKAYYL